MQNPIYHLWHMVQNKTCTLEKALAEIEQTSFQQQVTIEHLTASYERVGKAIAPDKIVTDAGLNEMTSLARLNCQVARTKNSWKIAQGNCHNLLGRLYLRQNKLPDALAHYKEAIICFVGQPGVEAATIQILLDLGEIREREANLQAALEVYQKAQGMIKGVHHPQLTADIDNSLGNIYFLQGKVDEAAALFQKAKTLSSKEGLQRAEAAARGNLGRIDFYLGNWEKAEERHEVARQYCEKAGDRAGEGRHLGSLGLIRMMQGKDEEAERRLKEAVDIARQYGDRPSQIKQLARLGKLRQTRATRVPQGQRSEQLRTALNHYQEAEQIARQWHDPSAQGEQLMNIGGIHVQLTEFEAAQSCYKQAFELVGKAPDILWRLHYVWGNLWILQQQDAQAFDHYQAAIGIVEEQRHALKIESRAQFWQEKSALYKQMALCCLRQKKRLAALAYTELAKARYLADWIYENNPANQRLSVDDTIALIEETLNALPPESATVVFTVTKTETIIFIAPKEVIEQSTDQNASGWQQDGRLYVTSILGFGEEELKRLLVELDDKGEVQGGYLGDYYAHADRWQATLEATITTLSEKLLDTVWPQLDHLAIKRVVFIPNLGLSLLPLHACYTTNGVNRVYCLDRYEVTYAPSFQILRHCQSNRHNRPERATELFAVSNPTKNLPFAELEVALIQKFFSQSQVLDKLATKESILENAPRYTHLHFACHGRFELAQPLDSALVLATEKLTLKDIFPRKIELPNTRLVVMSACETGLIKPNDLADESINLPAGFLLATVPAVISTLWKVVDSLSTVILIEQFYHNLQDGKNYIDALRKAQQKVRNIGASEVLEYAEKYYRVQSGISMAKLLEEKKYYQHQVDQDRNLRPFEHPYYWAAYVISGE